MAQFSKAARRTPTSPIRTQVPPQQGVTPVADATTYEGGRGFTRDPESELYLLGASYLFGRPTFYESPSERDRRFVDLVHRVDADWLAGFIPYLRRTLNIRTAAVVAAAEYVNAGHPNGRKVVRDTLTRMDEPAELVGYWLARGGRNLPQPIKRGIADYLSARLNEYNALKYAGWGNRVALADVIQLTHPAPTDEVQSRLFQYLLAKRRGVPNVTPEGLEMHATREYLLSLPLDERRARVLNRPEAVLSAAGATWEWVASTLLPGGMGAQEWAAVIPQMGVMALLRNLRNFDEAKVDRDAVQAVTAKLVDADEVAKSRILPLRVLQAHLATSRVQWTVALEMALRLATRNVPEFDGPTVALADVSGSMTMGWLRGAHQAEQAVAFAAVTADRSGPGSTMWVYSNAIEQLPVGDALPTVEAAKRSRPWGGGTNTVEAVLHAVRHTPNARRVVIVTDEQAFASDGYYWSRLADIKVPVYTYNVAGYAKGWVPSGQANRFTVGGLSDAGFQLIAAIEQGASPGWPWQ